MINLIKFFECRRFSAWVCFAALAVVVSPSGAGQTAEAPSNVEYNGYLALPGKRMGSFSVGKEESAVWLEPGQSRWGIRLEEIEGSGQWVRVTVSGVTRTIPFAKPKIIDPLTYRRTRTHSGFGDLSVQDVIDEEKRADRVEMDLLVSYQLMKERKEKALAEQRQRNLNRDQ